MLDVVQATLSDESLVGVAGVTVTEVATPLAGLVNVCDFYVLLSILTDWCAHQGMASGLEFVSTSVIVPEVQVLISEVNVAVESIISDVDALFLGVTVLVSDMFVQAYIAF